MLEFKPNKVFLPIIENEQQAGKRYILCLGGRGSGKTYFISELILMLLIGMIKPHKVRIGILRYDLKSAKGTLFKEICDRIRERGLEEEFHIDNHTGTIRYGENELYSHGFKQSDKSQTAKQKGLASYTHIFIEEAEEVQDYRDFQQLDDSIRDKEDPITKEVLVRTHIYLICNPMYKQHWIIEKHFDLIPTEYKLENEVFFDTRLKSDLEFNYLYNFTTYKDNVYNSKQFSENAERNKTRDPEYYYNQILGLVSGGKMGRVYTNWEEISLDKFRELDLAMSFGLDWGYSNDPAAVVAVKIDFDNKIMYVDEVIYDTGLDNDDIILGIQREYPEYVYNTEIYADHEPKDNDYLTERGLIVMPADKSAFSRKDGVAAIRRFKVYYTSRSTNIAKESAVYSFAMTRTGMSKNEPQDGNDHALDAIRMAFYSQYGNGNGSFWSNLLREGTQIFN